MEGLQAVSGAMRSSLLRRLVTPGELLPDTQEPLGQLLEAADWDQAVAQGRILPTRVRSHALRQCEGLVLAFECTWQLSAW